MDIRFFLITIILFISCNNSNKPIEKSNAQVIEIDIKQDRTEVDFDAYFTALSVVPLETTAHSIFSKIDRISLHQNKIFILDKKLDAVFVFEETGEFLFKIRNTGKGPQEYDSLMDFTLDEKNNNIILYTDRPYGIIVHDMNGVFIKKRKLRNFYSHLASLGNKLIFLNKDFKKKHYVVEYDLVSKKEKGFLDINDRDEIYKRYSIGRPYVIKDKNIHLSFPYSQTIYEYTQSGVKAKYYINFGEQNLPESAYNKNKSFRELFNYAKKNNLGYGICEFRENKNYITFNYNITNSVIYSKKTKDYKVINFIHNENMISGNYIAHNGDDNKYVATYSASSFKKQMNLHKENEETWSKVPEKIKNMDSQISENDNPILLIYTFKE